MPNGIEKRKGDLFVALTRLRPMTPRNHQSLSSSMDPLISLMWPPLQRCLKRRQKPLFFQMTSTISSAILQSLRDLQLTVSRRLSL